MSRAYLRLDPNAYERKVIQQGYSLQLYAAFMGVLCVAERQPTRGVFRDERLLRALLGPAGRYVTDMIAKGDLIVRADGTLYVDGWEEWQEGDWKVGERVQRIRNRKRTAPTVTPTVTPVTEPTVDTPSDGDRLSVIDGGGGDVANPPNPPSRRGGRRADKTNARALAAEMTRQLEEAARERRSRRNARQLAYLDGRITEAQRDEMDETDAPLSEIPPKRGAAYQGLPA